MLFLALERARNSGCKQDSSLDSESSKKICPILYLFLSNLLLFLFIRAQFRSPIACCGRASMQNWKEATRAHHTAPTQISGISFSEPESNYIKASEVYATQHYYVLYINYHLNFNNLSEMNFHFAIRLILLHFSTVKVTNHHLFKPCNSDAARKQMTI